MKRSQAFMARLRAGESLLADGATGTLLHSMGLEGKAPEAWVLERPDAIRAMHQAYIEAGADIVLTCTFGGSRYRLAGEGLSDRVVEVNRRAAGLARETAGKGILVAGDMGPTGQLMQPLGQLAAEEAAEAFAQQAAALTEGGVDFLLIETMSDLGEARAAIEGARRVSDLPVFCTFSFDTHGRTMMGVKPEQVAAEIGPVVEGVGANCGRDPAEFPGFLQEMRRVLRACGAEAVLWAKPNAGLPHLEGDRVVYDATPEYMGRIADQLREAGAQIVGGCCGTTPAHVSAMAANLKGEGV
jgi:5-methyltetrahydrofolate--homocysteine methyltransferase